MNNLFDFIRVDNFLDNINREDCFDTRDMDGVSPNYKIILASDCPSNVDDCIDEDGTLTSSVKIIETEGVDDGYVSMLWTKGINGERTMSISDSSVTYSLGDTVTTLKAMFLVNIADGSGFVIAYSISDKEIEIEGDLIFPINGAVWSIRYGG